MLEKVKKTDFDTGTQIETLFENELELREDLNSKNNKIKDLNSLNSKLKNEIHELIRQASLRKLKMQRQ